MSGSAYKGNNLITMAYSIGLLRNIVICGSPKRAADKQRCSSKALTNDSHALPWASVGNICESLLVYLLVMLLLIDTWQ